MGWIYSGEDDCEMSWLSFQALHTGTHSVKFIHSHKLSMQMFEGEDEDENSWRTDGFRENRSDLSNTRPNLFPQNLAHWNFSSAVLQIPICAAAYLNLMTMRHSLKTLLLNCFCGFWLDCKWVMFQLSEHNTTIDFYNHFTFRIKISLCDITIVFICSAPLQLHAMQMPSSVTATCA